MEILYRVHKGIYVNLTNRCSSACTFCLRQTMDHVGESHSLWLEREPTAQEVEDEFRKWDMSQFEEIVFCGFGEPMYRTDDILWLVDQLKEKVPHLPPVRINTNGHANLILGRDVTPELQGRIDTLSISLNGSTPAEYLAVTRPRDGEKAWHAMLDFALKAKEYVPNVVMTIVDKDKSEEEVDRCRQIVRDLGVTLRIRSYIED